MDVGFYLNELLMQQGEVSLPGLGYFVRSRMSSYYDENEGSFYPPYHQAQFEERATSDDALAEYIAAKKNISIASAVYFLEKYANGLKQDALQAEVPVGNLGWFYTGDGQLKFKPADKLVNDTAFYGLGAVKIGKAEPIEEDEDIGRPRRAWLVVLMLVIIFGICTFALYLYSYNPAAFDQLKFWEHNTAVVNTVKPKALPKLDTPKTDTLKTDSAAANKPMDTIAKAKTPIEKPEITKKNEVKTAIPDLTGTRHFEAIAATCRDTTSANKIIKKLKLKGVDAKIITNGPSPVMISVGSFKTEKEARDFSVKMEESGKVTGEVYPQEIIPK